jgi:EpsI family protein
LLTFGLSYGIEFRQKIPINWSFSQFPMQVGEWHGATEIMDKKFSDFLNFSDYIIANYANPEGKAVNLYVAYYQDQRKGESIHSPETCLPGGGWEFKEAGDATIAAFGR